MGSLLDKVKKILSNGSNRGKTMTGEPKEPIIINPTVKNESVINKENEHDRSTSSVVEEGVSGSRSCGCGRGQKGCSGSCGCSSQGGSSCGKGSCSCEGSSEEAGTQAEESVTEAEVKVRAPLYREIRKPKKDTPLSVRAHAAVPYCRLSSRSSLRLTDFLLPWQYHRPVSGTCHWIEPA